MSDHIDQASDATRDTVSRPLITLLALAATLVAAIAVWRIIRPEPAPQPSTPARTAGTPSASPPPMLLVEKLPVRVSADRVLPRGRSGGQQAFLDDFGRALAPYREDRYEDAVIQMRNLAAAYKDAPEPPLYEGVSLLMLQRSADAVRALERARKLAGKRALSRDAEYYHAVALVLAGRPAGRGAIQRICELEGPYKSQSCQALRSLSPKR